MDVQLKKGLIEAYVLTLLRYNDTYGYLLIKQVDDAFRISETALYPILRRLQSQGCLSTYTMQYDNRLRKYYRLTPAGNIRLQEYKNQCYAIKGIVDFIVSQPN